MIYEEQRKLAEFQTQSKKQIAHYDDDLARKRMQACDLMFFSFKLNSSFDTHDTHEEGCN